MTGYSGNSYMIIGSYMKIVTPKFVYYCYDNKENSLFTNFPSRLLTYLENNMAVWSVTDLNTDIGKVVAHNDFGFGALNSDLSSFILEVEKELNNREVNTERGKKGFTFIKENKSVLNSYNSII